MDQIVKADVDEEQIAPFMQDISRYFEYIDKDDLIKKIVSLEFGKFLAYYADAPDLTPITSTKGEGSKNAKGGKEAKGHTTPRPRREGHGGGSSPGMRKLFINLGKKDGFYPGELMQFLNQNVRGHVDVGHIDLLNTISYFEVPEEDAQRVVKYINGQRYKGRDVRCNDGEQTHPQPLPIREGSKYSKGEKRNYPQGKQAKGAEGSKYSKGGKQAKGHSTPRPHREGRGEGLPGVGLPKPRELKGEIPNFEEEGWAIRKPRKK